MLKTTHMVTLTCGQFPGVTQWNSSVWFWAWLGTYIREEIIRSQPQKSPMDKIHTQSVQMLHWRHLLCFWRKTELPLMKSSNNKVSLRQWFFQGEKCFIMAFSQSKSRNLNVWSFGVPEDKIKEQSKNGFKTLSFVLVSPFKPLSCLTR